MKLDKKWQCCGHKPICYKPRTWPYPLDGSVRHHPRMLYLCTYCSREYDLHGAQRENWAWKMNAAGSISTCQKREFEQ